MAKKQAEKRYHVLALKIQNLRNVEIVEVDFRNKKFVEINGENGAAKTTVVDGLFGALIGRKHFGGKHAWVVIKKGENKALMKALIGSAEREIEVKRSITKITREDGSIETGGSLVIQDTKGEKLGQEFLDNLVSELTMDPLAFARKNAKEQVEVVKSLAGIDTRKVEAKAVDLFQERTLVNRELKRAQGSAQRLVCVPADFTDITAINNERKEVEEFNREQEARQRNLDEKGRDVSDTLADMEEVEKRIKALTAELEEFRENKKAFEAEIKGLPVPEKRRPTEQLDAMIDDAGRQNEKAQKYKEYSEALKEQESKAAESEKLTKKIGALRAECAKMIEESELPFKNAEFSDDLGLLIDDIPFSQKSDAEKLRISARIGMELRPDFRIMFIREGSMLDDESYAVVRDLSQKFGYQILVEHVGERPGEDCIVMRAGSVVSKFEHVESKAERIDRLQTEL